MNWKRTACEVLLWGVVLLPSAGWAQNPGHSSIPPELYEFRFAGAGLVCVTPAEEGKPPPENYDQCLRIGPIQVHQEEAKVRALLGKPFRELNAGDGTRLLVFPLPEFKNEIPYYVIGFREKRVVSIQLTGIHNGREDAFSSIRLGDPEKKVLLILGHPRKKSDVKDVSAILWDYVPYPISIEFKESRVFSMRVALPK